MEEQKMDSFKLPLDWVNRIFSRFHEIWGDKYLEAFCSLNRFEMEQARWQAGLYGLGAQEIKKVLDMCKDGIIRDMPNVIEFYHYAKGNKAPPPSLPKPQAEFPASPTIAKQYINLIKDKLHGRTTRTEGDIALSTLDQQVLGDAAKQEKIAPHWQDN